MAIVNEYGQPFLYSNHQAARAARRGDGMRPYEPVQLYDIGKLVPRRDRETLLSASRRLYLNQPILAGAIEQKSMYAIGRAWLPKFQGTDTEFGKLATEWLVNQWYPLCDIRGTDYDFKTALYGLSNAISRDGGEFIYLTFDDTGFPRIQNIPYHRIGNPAGTNDGPIESGLYRNALLRDGVVYNRVGQPVAYAYLNEKRELDKYISARDTIHSFDPAWSEMGRGLPAFTHSLNMLRDALQSHEWEHMAQLMLSSIGLIEKNETGGPDYDDPSLALTGVVNNLPTSGVSVETYQGGQVRYFKANSGGGLETIKNDRPGEAWENFQDRVIRMALAGDNWPYSLVWKPSGQGTAERHEIAKAQRAVEDRQDLIEKAAHRMVSYAIAKAQKLGILPQSADWWKWTFTKPQKLTIDDGRVSKELIEGWKAGYINQTDILGAYGKPLDDHLRERAIEIAKRKLIAAEISQEYGIEIEEREMAMLNPNEMGKPEPVGNDENSSD
jgi:hypothetical protein